MVKTVINHLFIAFYFIFYFRLLKKYNKYKEFMQLRKTGEEDIEEKTWTKEDQAELEMESKKAKLSCTFVTIK